MTKKTAEESEVTSLNFSKPYGEVRGKARYNMGVHYAQFGKYFNNSGVEVNITTGELMGPVAVVDPTGAPETNLVDPVEFEYDTSIIQTLEDFDDFADALITMDKKTANRNLKLFAIDVVGMKKLNTNRKLQAAVEEVQAEFKAMLESGIE